MGKRTEYMRKWRKANRDKVIEAEARRRKKGRPKHEVYLKEWAGRNRNRVREYSRRHRLKKVGATLEYYDGILRSQGHVCAICGQRNSRGRSLAIDHDHATGKMRGLLCHNCNVTLGLMRDSPELLDRAAEYLRNWLRCLD